MKKAWVEQLTRTNEPQCDLVSRQGDLISSGSGCDLTVSYDAPATVNFQPLDYDRLVKNFWKHVDASGGKSACWPWTGGKQSKGYGSVGYLCADGKHRTFLAHRIAWMLTTSQPLLPEILICHHCDNTECCNPRHMFAGSASDNMQDALRKGRMFIGPLNNNYRHGLFIDQKKKREEARAARLAAKKGAQS